MTTKKILYSINKPMKEFTSLLKEFTKKNSEKGNQWTIELNTKDSMDIFDICRDIILDKLESKLKKYNALRLMKYSLYNQALLMGRNDEIIELIKHCLLYEKGNISLELVNFVRHLNFSFDCTVGLGKRKKSEKQVKIYKEVFPKIADLYIFLQNLDREYQLKNQEELDYGDLNIEGRLIYSGDTENKFLKHVRRIMEVINSGYFEERMIEQGYTSVILDNPDEIARSENIVKLTQEQKDKLWGVNGPYSEVKVIKETRILDDSVSSTMMYVEGSINPLTFEIIEANQNSFDPKYGLKTMLECAEYRGQKDGYVVALSPYIQYSDEEKHEIEQQIEIFRKQAEKVFIYIHKFVMRLLNIKGSGGCAN